MNGTKNRRRLNYNRMKYTYQQLTDGKVRMETFVNNPNFFKIEDQGEYWHVFMKAQETEKPGIYSTLLIDLIVNDRIYVVAFLKNGKAAYRYDENV